MIDLYNKNVFCMDFTAKEIDEYFIEPLKKEHKINVNPRTENGRIKSIFFDTNVGDFFVSFYGHQTSICISDEIRLPQPSYTFNEEFMFIDDKTKIDIVSSDTYGNIVYEGTLRDKTHKEILQIFISFIIILNGSTKISVEEIFVSQEGYQYPKCNYNIIISKESKIKQNINIKNISFCIK